MTEPRVLPCPSCGSEFVVGVRRCASCGLALTGPLAVRLWQIDQDLEALTKRRALALDDLRRSGAAASFATTERYPELARAAPSTSASASASSPESSSYSYVAPEPSVAGGTAQHLLLGIGVFLMFVASVVFIAFTWDALGVYGRMFALVVAIIACGGLASYCSNRLLSSSAEAFAILAVGMSVVGLSASYALDLFGLGSLTLHYYFAFAAFALAAVMAAMHPVARPVMTYPLVALAASWVAAFALFVDSSPIGWAAGLMAGWLVLASPALRWARAVADPGAQLTGTPSSIWALYGAAGARPFAPLWPPALISGVTGFGVATVLIASATADAAALAGAIALVAVGLLVVGYALRAHRPFAELPRRLLVPALAVWVAVGIEIAAVVRNAGVPATVVLVAVAIVVLLVLLCVRSQRTQTWSPHVGTTAVGAGVAAAALVVLDGDSGASAFVLALVAAGAAALAVAEPPWRVRAEFVGAASGLAALAFAFVATDASSSASALGFSAGGVLLAVLAAVRRRANHEEEAVLGLGSVVAFAASIGIALSAVIAIDDGSSASSQGTVLAVAFGVAALAGLGYALLPERGIVVVVGLPLAVAAVWTPMFDRGVDGVESYTLTAAFVCAVVGLVTRARVPDAGSWIVVGPALGFALLPSALIATSSDSSARVVYVLVVGAITMLIGFSLRWQAMFAISAVALALVSVQELFLFVVGLPPTLTFLGAGAILVAAGVRYERNMRDLRTVGVWFDRMT